MTKNTKIRFDIKGRWSEDINYNSLFKDTRSEKLKIFHMSGWENTISFIVLTHWNIEVVEVA